MNRSASSRAFRFPREMHVPRSAVAIHFQLDPDIRWIGRSFISWLRPPVIEIPAWLG